MLGIYCGTIFIRKTQNYGLFLKFVLLLPISPVHVADRRSSTPLGHRPGE